VNPVEFCDLFRTFRDETGCDEAVAATMTLAYVIDKFHSQHSADVLADAIGRGIEQGFGPDGPLRISDAIRDAADAVRESATGG
jgi:hypothetical protein